MSTPPSGLRALVRLHLRWGWSALALFIALGLLLEGLHAFKAPAYLDVGAEPRRLVWSLAHAHGTLLGLVNLGFAWTLTRLEGFPRAPLASAALRAGTVLLPLGFLLGGIGVRGGDPGIGVWLVPPGALALVLAAGLTALATR